MLPARVAETTVTRLRSASEPVQAGPRRVRVNFAPPWTGEWSERTSAAGQASHGARLQLTAVPHCGAPLRNQAPGQLVC